MGGGESASVLTQQQQFDILGRSDPILLQVLLDLFASLQRSSLLRAQGAAHDCSGGPGSGGSGRRGGPGSWSRRGRDEESLVSLEYGEERFPFCRVPVRALGSVTPGSRYRRVPLSPSLPLRCRSDVTRRATAGAARH